MGKVKISKVVDGAFGNCIQMSNGIIELKVTVDFGPRIIHFSLAGKENMFYNDAEKLPLGDTYDIYNGDVCRLYGGHRLWISPEILPRCYHPDNLPVVYNETENGMEFSAAVEKENCIQKKITITMEPDEAAVSLTHEIKNTGAWEIELAPWCITMLDKGGKAVLPQPDKKTGVLHNRSFSLWDYSEMNDSRIYWGKDYITLTQDSRKPNPFKVGYNNEDGWAAYFNKGQVFIKFFEAVTEGMYPDNGCSYETYTNGVMLESETLGELVILPPGETVSHEEQWEIYGQAAIPSNDEQEIRAIMSNYIIQG